MLIDMELLAHTDYFVGSYNSRWATISASHLHPGLLIRASTAHCTLPLCLAWRLPLDDLLYQAGLGRGVACMRKVQFCTLAAA